jgi:hypothetical protein
LDKKNVRGRNVTEKTAKVVWSKSGGMCAYPECRKLLIAAAPDDNSDPHALTGQMAHIVAHSDDGPRGGLAFLGSDRDGPENLILLCVEHHILIDQQRKSHTTGWLYQMKERHEQWVKDRLSPQQRFLQAHASTSLVTDTLHSTLLPVRHLPLTVFSAPCEQTPLEIQKRLIYPDEAENMIYCPYILHGGQLLAFNDLSQAEGPFSACIDPRTSQRMPFQERWDDPDQGRLYVMLLNRTLNKITGRRGLYWDKDHQRYYFPPLPGPRKREISYKSLQGNTTSRLVAWQPMSRKTGKVRAYWEHMAISLHFHRAGELSWCLSLRPERYYTLDGSQVLEGKQTGRKATQRISRIHNYDLLVELNFWRAFLSGGDPRIICQFGSQNLIIDTELISTSVTWPGIPDDSRPFSNQRFREDMFSLAEYESALTSEFGDLDTWEEEEGASEDY